MFRFTTEQVDFFIKEMFKMPMVNENKKLEKQNKGCRKSRWSVLCSVLLSEHLVRAQYKAISLHIQAQQL